MEEELRRRAYRHYVEATRLMTQGSLADVKRHLDYACILTPNDPVVRFLLGAISLSMESWDPAYQHFERGLLVERGAFRRGQLLLWGSRAADAVGAKLRAQTMRDELLRLVDEDLSDYQKAARAENKKPFSKRKCKAVHVNLILVDAF